MAKRSTIGIGIIGCGGRMQNIAGKLVARDKRIQIAALCDVLPESIEESRKSFNFDGPAYSDHRDLVKDPKVDWVMIGSWNCFHAEHTVAAFKAGKHVFCEKPFATNVRDCNRIVKAWRESGKHFTIGFTMRYSPHYVKIKQLIDKGAIGYPVSFEFSEVLTYAHGGHIMSDWRRKTDFTGTHLLEKCCHDIDLANWICGSIASRVASFGGVNVFLPKNKHFMKRVGKHESGRNNYLSWGQPEYVNPFTSDHDVIDNQVAIIEYKNGVRATFHTNLHSGIPERRMYVIGSEGAIRADLVANKIEIGKTGPREKIRQVPVTVKGGHGGGDTVLARSLADTVLRGKKPRTSVREGLLSSVTVFGIDKAMETGRVVNMAPLWRRVGMGEKGGIK